MNNIKVMGYGFTKETQGKTDIMECDLMVMLNNYSNHDLRQRGFYKLLGYFYNFAPYLKKYVVKTEYVLREVFAPNKTFLRKNKSSLYDLSGDIIYIIGVDK